MTGEPEMKSHCPACGKAGVVMSLNYVLLETRPAVRHHACGVGGPGSGVACPTCIHPEGYDRLSGACPTCRGSGTIESFGPDGGVR